MLTKLELTLAIKGHKHTKDFSFIDTAVEYRQLWLKKKSPTRVNMPIGYRVSINNNVFSQKYQRFYYY